MRDWEPGEPALCRPHRDAELGPRGAGAPQGNLNALVHGRYSNPLPPPDLERLVAVALDRPDDLPLEIGLAVRSIHARTACTLLTVHALCRLLSHVAARLSARLLRAELRAKLRSSPSASESANSLRANAQAPRPADRPLPRRLSTSRLPTRLARRLRQKG